METSTQTFKHCVVVSATGRIDASTAPQLAEAFAAVTDAGRYRIVFDMSGIEYISSVGLRVLIDTQKKCKQLNRGKLVLASISPLVQEALRLAGFYTLFEVYETTLEAVGNF
jgi:anti-sigma B factor antagonist